MLLGGNMLNGTSRNAIIWFFLALFLISIYLLGRLLMPFISVLILAAVVSGIFRPVYRSLVRNARPGFASFATCALIFIVLFMPIVFFVTTLASEAYDLYQMGRNAVISKQVNALLAGSQVLDRVNQLLAGFNYQITGDELNRALSETGKVVGLFLYQQAQAIASNILNFLVYFFFMLLIIFYLLIDGDRLIDFVKDLSPLPDDQDEKLILKFKDMAGAVLIGNGLCGVIQGGIGGTVFYLFDLNSPFLWGVIMGLLAFLPILGIGLVFIPTALFLFLKGNTGGGLFFIIFYVILSGSIEYLLKPKVVGQRVKMHTLLVFLSIMGGLKVFGILGIIYGPLIITLFLTLTDIYHVNYQKQVETGDAADSDKNTGDGQVPGM
jgi:predicted PurR-regulated permease PerM